MRTISLRRRLCAAAFAAASLFTTDAVAQVPAEAEDRLRGIWERGDYGSLSFQAVWLPDGSGYTRLERPAGGDAADLVRYDAATGERTVLVSSGAVAGGGSIEQYAISPDGGIVMVQTSAPADAPDAGRATQLIAFDLASRRPGIRVADVQPGISNESFSPDGSRILFRRDGDLYVASLATGGTLRLIREATPDAMPDSIRIDQGMWSPDGRHVAYIRTDVSKLPVRTLLLPTDPSYPEVREVRFARVGETIPALDIGVVSADGGATRWLPLPGAPEGFYFGEVSWSGDSELFVELFTRGRDARALLLVDVRTGAVTRLYEETDRAWVVASYPTNSGIDWIRGDAAFLLLSEKDGWRHAYVHARDGAQLDVLTPGESDVIGRVHIDDERGWFYYYASPDNATQRYLYRVRLDGSGTPERVTPADQPGWHDYNVSPDGSWAFHTRSSFEQPPMTELIRMQDHRVVRVLEDNAALRTRVQPMVGGNTEFLQLDIGDGVVMDAWMIRPRDFDPALKYPLFVYVYGEPHAQTVRDLWSSNQVFHQTIADLGYIVVSIDNRGTPSPKGAAWARAIFPYLGPLSTEEQAAGVLELGRTRPYIDLTRVGVWGWSGGGSNTLNAMFRRPDVFHVGIAVAPKPQPHLYNAWFQEIYMRTREENPDGYRESAPINFAEGLEGDLLIIHGTGETNTHLEITEGLVDRLIELGKTFDYMTYPNRDHGINEGDGTSLHLRMLMTRYLLEHLEPGGR
ncbi:MAG: DPP IV N-terminal domain-containing protein [Gemmatimonadota bacterium]